MPINFFTWKIYVCVSVINFVMVPCRYLRGKVLYFFPLLVGMGLEKVEWGGEGRGGEGRVGVLWAL